MNKLLLIGLTFLLMACETGTKSSNNTHITTNNSNKPASGIVTITETSQPRSLSSRQTVHSQKKMEKVIPSKINIKKILSKSAVPGYYLQIGFFKKNPPSKQLETKLQNSKFNFIFLQKQGNYHALIGPYKAVSFALKVRPDIKKSFNTDSLVVKILRP